MVVARAGAQSNAPAVLQVGSMCRQLLAMLHVREFAEEAQFVDPCSPLVLPAVACGHCFTVAPLDVTRSASLEPRGWRCGVCMQPHDAAAIEAALMARLRAATAASAVWDIKCGKCKALSRGGAQIACGDCGGSFVFERGGGTLKLEAQVLESVADFNGFELLREAAQWVVKS